jgi:hypothetical protein
MDNLYLNPRVYIEKSIPGQCWYVYLQGRNVVKESRFNAESINWKPIESSAIAMEPLFTLNDDEIQKLMNELWSAGVRPSDSLRDPINSKHLIDEIEYLRGLHKVGFATILELAQIENERRRVTKQPKLKIYPEG